MKRYIEEREIQARFLLAYFFYGRVKYGSSGYSEERLARLSAYKSVMNLYRPLAREHARVRSEAVLRRFDLLHERAKALEECIFKRVFLETLAQSDPRRRSPES
jgi:hypothetical protein